MGLLMPKFLEDKLRAEYGNNPRAIYGTMNNIGAMRGNKETAKGARMQAKHDRDMKAGTASNQHPHKNLGRYLHLPKGKRGK